MKNGMTKLNQANISNDPKTCFKQVADQWDDIRAGYFTEQMRDSAIAKANLHRDALVSDIGTGTGFAAIGRK